MPRTADPVDYAGTLPYAPSGMVERVALYAGLRWFGAAAVRLLGQPVR